MPDTRSYVASSAVQPSATDHSRSDGASIDLTRLSAVSRPEVAGKYEAVSPKGVHISIPKELFVALSDFIKTRKCPGSITIDFRNGEILCVESVAKKTYRK